MNILPVPVTHAAVAFNSLLLNARTDTQTGLGQLLIAFEPPLYQIARERVGRRLDRRVSDCDIVQETLLTAIRKFDEFRGTSVNEFRCWLICILESRISDNLRKHCVSQRRRQSRERSGLTGALRDPSGSTLEQVVTRETAGRLAAAIRGLNDELRQIVVMRMQDQHSFERIGQELRLPTATVWRRWINSIDQLSKTLQG